MRQRIVHYLKDKQLDRSLLLNLAMLPHEIGLLETIGVTAMTAQQFVDFNESTHDGVSPDGLYEETMISLNDLLHKVGKFSADGKLLEYTFADCPSDVEPSVITWDNLGHMTKIFSNGYTEEVSYPEPKSGSDEYQVSYYGSARASRIILAVKEGRLNSGVDTTEGTVTAIYKYEYSGEKFRSHELVKELITATGHDDTITVHEHTSFLEWAKEYTFPAVPRVLDPEHPQSDEKLPPVGDRVNAVSVRERLTDSLLSDIVLTKLGFFPYEVAILGHLHLEVMTPKDFQSYYEEVFTMQPPMGIYAGLLTKLEILLGDTGCFNDAGELTTRYRSGSTVRFTYRMGELIRVVSPERVVEVRRSATTTRILTTLSDLTKARTVELGTMGELISIELHTPIPSTTFYHRSYEPGDRLRREENGDHVTLDHSALLEWTDAYIEKIISGEPKELSPGAKGETGWTPYYLTAPRLRALGLESYEIELLSYLGIDEKENISDQVLRSFPGTLRGEYRYVFLGLKRVLSAETPMSDDEEATIASSHEKRSEAIALFHNESGARPPEVYCEYRGGSIVSRVIKEPLSEEVTWFRDERPLKRVLWDTDNGRELSKETVFVYSSLLPEFLEQEIVTSYSAGVVTVVDVFSYSVTAEGFATKIDSLLEKNLDEQPFKLASD